jgi:hypothetical protein
LQYNRRDFEEPNGTKMSGDQVEADELNTPQMDEIAE